MNLHLDRACGQATRVALDESAEGVVAVVGDLVRFHAAPKQIVSLRLEE